MALYSIIWVGTARELAASLDVGMVGSVHQMDAALLVE